MTPASPGPPFSKELPCSCHNRRSPTQWSASTALRSAGLDDRTIFEATAFIAFRLAFSTVNDALGANPDWQLVGTAPPEVRSAVTYGRPPQAAPADGSPQ
jgi:hypothetical protein